ncbi:chemotaxis protein CheW [uncultured Shewanella sp.]|uniref:chemotaxis protein CheW n=1 Tax=uncultured Shewanella sp. TaxID=173975 RepID=UPI002625D41D|nr:chemotaxis protein CheW [uncultured Shewanella sp.]
MSKSVDETVFDFFSVLLQEPAIDAPIHDAPIDDAPIHEASVPDTLASDLASSNEKISGKFSKIDSVSLKKQHSKTISKPNIQSQLNGNPQLNDNELTGKYKPVGAAQTVKVDPSEAKKTFAEPQVDKAALSKLLSAVSKPAIKLEQDSAVKGSGTVEASTAPAQRTQQQVQDDIKSKAQLVRQQLGQVIAEKAVSEKIETLSAIDNKESEISADINLDKVETNISETDNEADSIDIQPSQLQQSAIPPSITRNLQDVLDDEFQVLFFNVAGLTLAVPLVSLGGIVKIEHINHLIGRPDWFLGVQTHRDQKANVVDSCRWVMPEKYTKELADSIDYQYLVMLEDSDWGLACESLVNAVRIDKSHVNWREKPGKRPWLAGVVKEQMCGILNVQALIEMLDAGLGCQDSID